MKIRIGFLHKKERVKIRFNGPFKTVPPEGSGKTIIQAGEYDVKLSEGVPARSQWYEKLETVFGIEKLDVVRSKYNVINVPTRVIRAGRKLGSTDNYEYWILKKCISMAGRIYPSGDYRFKNIVKKKPSGILTFNGHDFQNSIRFVPLEKYSTFTVEGVDVGIGFHWDHKENLEYSGELEIITDTSGKLTCVNIIGIEEYLSSVNSSEMRNDNDIEMLKSQTVAARSTVLATMGKHHYGEGFDLCSDDHCQCYQGVSKVSMLSSEVTNLTAGQVLIFDNKIADARYAKICGGITERYSSCWEDLDYPYLASVFDNETGGKSEGVSEDKKAAEFISDNEFNCFCNTFKNPLPDSLSFCKDYFRWEKEISEEKIKENLKLKFEISAGKIRNIRVLKRGPSGRAVELEVEGSEKTFVVSKELNIRRLLSDTHLPSSAILISRISGGWKIKGAGWGHGVGLCQIGAQIMGEKGYTYKDILKHYYRGACLRNIRDL